jgi:hypothetical protein
MTDRRVRTSRATWAAALVIAIALGLLLGWLCARVVFVGSAVALIPWAIGGLVIGWFSPGWLFATIVGAVYGFALADTFLIAGYEGSAPLASVLLPFAALAVVGAVGGVVSALAGHGIHRLFSRS